MRYRTVAVVALIVMAGCLGSSPDGQTNESPIDDGDQEQAPPQDEDTEAGAGGSATGPGPVPDGTVSIEDVGYDYSLEARNGTLRTVAIQLENTGEVDLHPNVSLRIAHDGQRFYTDLDALSDLDRVAPGRSVTERITIAADLSDPGRYDVLVTVRSRNRSTGVAAASKIVTVR